MENLKEQIELLIYKSKYDEAADLFLKETGTTMTAIFKKNDYHFNGDKDKCDIYSVTLKRGNRKYKFDFGQSINESQYYKDKATDREFTMDGHNKKGGFKATIEYLKEYCKLIPGKSPSLYSVLACLTKYDPIDFNSFCSDYGYDADSITAKKTYKSVVKEYDKVCSLFNDDEIEAMQAIQ